MNNLNSNSLGLNQPSVPPQGIPPGPSAEANAIGTVSTTPLFTPPMEPAVRDAEAIIKRNTLIVTATAASAAAAAQGVEAYYQGKQMQTKQDSMITKVYDKLRKNEAFSNEDAIFHLTTHKVSDKKILETLESAGRVDPEYNYQITKIGGRRVAVKTGEKSEMAEQFQNSSEDALPVQNSTTCFSEEDFSNDPQEPLFEERESQNEGSQGFSVDPNEAVQDRPQTEYLVGVSPNSNDGPPRADFPIKYNLLVWSFICLCGLFGLLAVHVNAYKVEIFKEQVYASQQNKLILILLQYHQKLISVDKAKVLLTEECFLSEETIDELLSQLRRFPPL